MSEPFVFNGIDGSTGEYLLPGLPPAEVARLARGEAIDSAPLAELRARYRRDTEPSYAPLEGIDPTDLAQSGWGVIFAHDADPAVRAALAPLLEHRKAQAGKARERYYREFAGENGYRARDPRESKRSFLARGGAAPGMPADPEKVPYYLLIVADPAAVPYRFQYQLDVEYAVGRVWFEKDGKPDLEAFARYAQSVVEAESGRLALPRRAVFFGAKNDDDRSTLLSARDLVAPLAEKVAASRPDWSFQTVLAGEARKDRLARLLGGRDTPALLFTASHGVGFSEGDPRQFPHQGALLCQEWPGPQQWRWKLPEGFYFAGTDVPADAQLLGLIAFHFACYGAGTPSLDDFPHEKLLKQRATLAPRPFVAGLPQRLLGHPRGGALAVVGHVERAWSCSFHGGPTLGRQLQVFESTFKRLLAGHPIGSALEYFNQLYAAQSSGLSDELENVKYGKVPDELELSSLWTANNDARNYVVLGDPAVRLAATAPPDAATGRDRSLSASLQYSLQRLTAEQRGLVLRLAPFEGGAGEEELLAVTVISEAEWGELRPALEQAALVAVERVHTDIPAPFLRFHPVLAPFLRGQPGGDDPALQASHADCYSRLGEELFSADTRAPHAARARARRELPNMRRAFDYLLGHGKPDQAAVLADRAARFLTAAGRQREADELRQRVASAAAAVPRPERPWTPAEWLAEVGLGEGEFTGGRFAATCDRFRRALARAAALPEGAPLGRGSYEQYVTLHWLARCLDKLGQPSEAAERLTEALALLDALLSRDPDHRPLIQQRGRLLVDLGDVFLAGNRPDDAQAVYQQALQVAERFDDLRGQAVILDRLAQLSLNAGDYPLAARCYATVRDLYQAIDEPAGEAVAWYQLGRVSQEQKQWAEAERCYRESVAIWDRQGNEAEVAKTYNQLGVLAQAAGHLREAEGWYRRAVTVGEGLQKDAALAAHLHNLAALLTRTCASGGPKEGVTAARGIAERALAIHQHLGPSPEAWKTHQVLADIADLEGRAETAGQHRHQARAAFASGPGNLAEIERLYGPLIVSIANAVRGSGAARAALAALFPRMADAGLGQIPAAVQRLEAGERDWDALAAELDGPQAALVKRVLEVLSLASPGAPREAQAAGRRRRP